MNKNIFLLFALVVIVMKLTPTYAHAFDEKKQIEKIAKEVEEGEGDCEDEDEDDCE